MSHRIVAVSGRPDLAPIVARWRVAAFYDYPGGATVAEIEERILAPSTTPKETFVLLHGEQPAGTAGLVRQDLKSRPDLMPWLAGVFVEPAFRGRGYASALVRRVEAFALAASVPVLWLYTSTAEPLYASLGWERVGLEPDYGGEVALMRRKLF
jgi:GNAT superfamily N-acetyltransferase